MGRNLSELKNTQLLRNGISALRGHARGEHLEYLAELERRRSRLARDCAKHLRAKAKQASSQPVSEHTIRFRDAEQGRVSLSRSAPVMVFDTDISELRTKLVKNAKDSIWLSSLTPPSEELHRLLVQRARSGVDVHVIVAERTFHTHHERRLDSMDDAGIYWALPGSTHSKLLVIDETIVLVGSANAHGGHRDAACLFSDEVQAQKAIDYLADIVDSIDG